MSTYTISNNVADQRAEGYALKPIAPSLSTNFRPTKDTSNESILKNLTSPLGLDNKFRYTYSVMENIYKGSGIEAASQSPIKKGVKVLCQNIETWSKSDPTDATVPAFSLPVECHLVLTIPSDPLITESDIIALVNRTMGGLFDTNTKYLKALIRGITDLSEV